MSGRGGRTEAWVKFATRCYAKVLRRFHASLYERDGTEMLRTFEARSRDVIGRGGRIALIPFLFHEMIDAARVALRRGSGRSSKGGPTRVPAATRHSFGVLASSVQQAGRYLRARPGYAFVFVLTFALGLGVNAALFALVSAVALRPLPYRSPERLIQLWSYNEEVELDSPSLPWEAFEAWAEFSDLLDGMEGWTGPGRRTLTGAGAPERIDAPGVTTGLFEFLGVTPRAGRLFDSREGASGAKVVLIGDGLWARYFSREPEAIGSTLYFDGEAYTVIGVMPRGFGFPYGTSEAWFPVARTTGALRDAGSISTIARLRPGVAVEDAEDLLVERVRAAQQAGAAPAGLMPMVVGLSDFLQTPERTQRGMVMLFGSVLLVLAIAFANVLSLRMADALRRQREIAMRSALGAGRQRILFELGIEGLSLALLGAILGLAIAQVLLRAIVPILPEQLGINSGRALALWPDGVAYGLVVSAVLGPVLGILPALLLSNRTNSLHAGTRSTTELRGVRLQSGLITFEVALSLVLLAGAGLLVNSFARLSTRDPGVAADELILAELTLGPSFDNDAERAIQFDRYEERLRRIDGVRSVAVTTSPLPRSLARFRPKLESSATSIEFDGFLPYNEVDPGYFETAGIEILRGSGFGAAHAGEPVVVVNDVLARRLWPNAEAIGSRFRARERDPWLTVIGVARDVAQMGLRDEWGEAMEYYVPLGNDAASARRTFLVRTSAAPSQLVHPIRQAIWEVDETQPIDRIEPFRDALGETIARERFFLTLLVLFAALATLLAAVGLHAVLCQVLLRRTPELAIRMALGASRPGVLWLTVGGSLRMVGAGIVIGLMLAALLTRFLDTLLFGVEAIDPLTFAADTLLLLVVGVLASVAAARRAIALDPALVMRGH